MASIAVIGAGYVGAVSGACFAKLGHTVACADVDRRKVDAINGGKSPIFEPGLGEAIKEAVGAGKLRATIDVKKAAADSDFIFICVGTPSGKSGKADLKYVKSAARAIASGIRKGEGRKIVIMKSTVPPGTSREIGKLIAGRGGTEIGMCSNPEFLAEGRAVLDFLAPDRIVVGSEKREWAEAVMGLYSGLAGTRFITDLETAEISKYASNAFLAMKISFANELANLCQELGVDVYPVADAMGADARIGRKFLDAGAGWGGSCFGKDIRSLLRTARNRGVRLLVVEAAVAANRGQPHQMVALLAKRLGGLGGKRIAVLGLAFKPGTNDMREAVSIPIIEELLLLGAKVCAYDPAARGEAGKIFGTRVEFAESAKAALAGADGCLLVTEWPEFSKLGDADFALMKRKVVVEGRRCLPDSAKAGLEYEGIGRKGMG